MAQRLTQMMSQAVQIMSTNDVAPQHSLPAARAAQQSALNCPTEVAMLPALCTAAVTSNSESAS